MARVEPIAGSVGRARRARSLRRVVTDEIGEENGIRDAVVARVTLWSVAKVALAFWTCIGIFVFAATFLMWQLLVVTGFVGNVERFVGQLTDDKTFHIQAAPLFASVFFIVCAFVIAATTMTIVAGSFYNLLASTIGGVRVRMSEDGEDG